MKKKQLMLQFKITLNRIEPLIWRRIQVPASYSFWDLHVAIQDAMGWFDYHLHAFRFGKPRQKKMTEIGIPLDDYPDLEVLPGWNIEITDYFQEPGDAAEYEYDFGDSWQHEVLLEGILLKEKGVRYPRCIAGERRYPPEDCGSVTGYYELLEILDDPSHEEHEGMVEWLQGHVTNYYPYQPDDFDPQKVKFTNPKKRWERAFSGL